MIICDFCKQATGDERVQRGAILWRSLSAGDPPISHVHIENARNGFRADLCNDCIPKVLEKMQRIVEAENMPRPHITR